MATVYATEYAAAYNTVPRVKRDPTMTGYKQTAFWNYTQSGAGNIGDVIYLLKIPPGSRIIMPECALFTVGCPATTVYDLGWLAYTEPDGDAVAADADGLANDIDPGADGLWFGGLSSGGGTPDDLLPAVLSYHFNAREEVILTLTTATAALEDGDIVRGYVTWING